MDEAINDPTNVPLTPGVLFDQSAAKTDLPPRAGRTFDEYLAAFTAPDVTHALEAAFEAAFRADVPTVRHWVRIAGQAWEIYQQTHQPPTET